MLTLRDQILTLLLFKAELAVGCENTTRKELRIDHCSLETRRCLERNILHITSLITEDGTEKLLFWCWICFALRRDLTDKDVAFANFRTDANNTAIVEILRSLFRDVRNFTSELLFATLCIAHLERVLFNVDRCKDVLSNHALADNNSIFEVVSTPWHEGNHHVTAERELAHIG